MLPQSAGVVIFVYNTERQEGVKISNAKVSPLKTNNGGLNTYQYWEYFEPIKSQYFGNILLYILNSAASRVFDSEKVISLISYCGVFPKSMTPT